MSNVNLHCEPRPKNNPKLVVLADTVIRYLVAQGPCDEAEEGFGYCEKDSCTYCAMGRAAQSLRKDDYE